MSPNRVFLHGLIDVKLHELLEGLSSPRSQYMRLPMDFRHAYTGSYWISLLWSLWRKVHWYSQCHPRHEISVSDHHQRSPHHHHHQRSTFQLG